MSKTVKPTTKPATTTDSGRVKVGSGCIRFGVKATTKSTHDAGRVQVGSGCMRF